MAPVQFQSKLYLSLSLLLFLPSTVTSQSYRNVPLGSSLTTESNSSWLSPSGEFAFGFQQIAPDGGYLLAIVFDEIPERTVAWSANRNNLVPRGSKLELTTSGRLVLTDPSGRHVWSPNSDPASHAAMLDTGNFVLAANDSSTLWESFQEPADTLLPTQTLEQGSQLIAKYSKSNHSQGRFKFILRRDRNLFLHATHYPEMRAGISYWPPAAGGQYYYTGDRVVFNQSSLSLDLILNNGTVVFPVFNNNRGSSSRDFYHRVTLDYDGVLRYYEYPKSNGKNSNKVWSSVYFKPPNICTAVTGDMGSGACGYNSYCELVNDQNPKCSCPPGYVLKDSYDESKGCIPDFAPQDCRLQEGNSDAFELVDMPAVDWPLHDYESFEFYTEDMCRQSCLSDCQCALVVYGKVLLEEEKSFVEWKSSIRQDREIVSQSEEI
ncbi:unnamed protein product [Linum tenue]|uniref:Bulb-type lectin domain-containing protein n=1 Tax=Linum tenue TaxID=586396 RepID=A0AAV0RGR8_9ROSI|nr:unnamed protein product [Linum tenue]